MTFSKLAQGFRTYSLSRLWQWYGEQYPLVKRSPNEFEYTEIIEVDG